MPLTQHLTRKATHSHWLREKRASVYSDLVDSLNNLETGLSRFADIPFDNNLSNMRAERYAEPYDKAYADFRGALSRTDLFAPPEIFKLLQMAYCEFESAATADDPDRYAKSFALLVKIKPQMVEIARKELDSL